MESSIAEFLSRKLACELLPTLFSGLSVCLSVFLSVCLPVLGCMHCIFGHAHVLPLVTHQM